MIHPCEKGYHLLLNLTRDRRAISSSSLDLGRALYFFGVFFWGGGCFHGWPHEGRCLRRTIRSSIFLWEERDTSTLMNTAWIDITLRVQTKGRCLDKRKKRSWMITIFFLSIKLIRIRQSCLSLEWLCRGWTLSLFVCLGACSSYVVHNYGRV